MKRRTASCPGCGAPVTFGIGSVVAICDFCKTTVAHGDKKVEDFGKVADLVETSTPLRRGLTGAINGKGFTIAGRVQYRHPAGGVWDEWYLQFSEGRWGWLADAQGSLLLTFERRLRHDAKLPSFESLSVGTNVELAGTPFSVYERGTGICATAEGEIPWDFRSGAEHRFIDLKDPQGRVATLEHGTKPRLFVGRQVSIDELNLAGEGWQKEPETVAAGGAAIELPQLCRPPRASGPRSVAAGHLPKLQLTARRQQRQTFLSENVEVERELSDRPSAGKRREIVRSDVHRDRLHAPVRDMGREDVPLE